ncbi:hypothetical protein BOX15_Mlig019799g1 [Macrostomum lignano]|uniref:Swiss cheese n=1 Tax=Macrostomum lignano TaxID=282301 RepID=A0A267EBR2_9PLAT|nr:hypothetical protein BOX15_Mlig019799g1 [Macrostomum lignano]
MGPFPFRLVPMLDEQHDILVLTGLIGLVVVLLAYYAYKRLYWSRSIPIPIDLPKLPRVPLFNDTRPHFRKRDRIRYWVRRVMRQAPLPNVLLEARRQKPAAAVSNILKYLRQVGPRGSVGRVPLARARISAIPDYFLEPEDRDADEPTMLNEFYLAIKSVRIFGSLERSFIMELCKCLEIMELRAGDALFKIGDIDGDMFIVQTGRVQLYMTEDGVQHRFHEFGPNQPVYSLLSFLDVLTGHPRPYRTLSAEAVTDAKVLRIPSRRLVGLFAQQQFQQTMVRIVQVITIRLQRVTFQALNNYLSLSTELFSADRQSLPDCEVLKLQGRIAELSGVPLLVSSKTAASAAAASSSGGAAEAAAAAASASLGDSGSSAAGGQSLIEQAQQQQRHYHQDQTPPVRVYTRSRSRSPSAAESSTAASDAQTVAAAVAASPDAPSVSASNDTDTDFDAAVEKALGNRRTKKGSLEGLEMGELPRRHMSLSLHSGGGGGGSGRRRTSRVPANEQSDAFLSTLMAAAKKDIAAVFGLPDASLLEDRVTLARVKAGAKLVRQGDHSPNLFFVVSGRLHLLQQCHPLSASAPPAVNTLYSVLPGEMTGMISALTGEASLFTIRCEEEAHVAVITCRDFYAVLRQQPSAALHVAHFIVRRMSPFLRQIDFVLDWLFLESGKPLYKQGDIASNVYIVLQGRLRQAHTTPEGHKQLTGELGRGDWIGFLEVFTLRPRATTVIAVRDSELAQIPVDLLNMIKRRHPHIVTRLITVLSQRLLGNIVDNPGGSGRGADMVDLHRVPMANLRSVALFPASSRVPLEAFALELQHALSIVGPSMRLTSQIVLKRFGRRAFERDNEYRMTSWLAQQEDNHRLLLYLCDLERTVWTRRCIRQADCLLIVALADEKVDAMNHVKRVVLPDSSRLLNMLILLHRESVEYPTPGKAAELLNKASEPHFDNQLVIQQHLHIRVPKRVFARRSSNRVLETYRAVLSEPPNPMSDMCRLARVITSTAVGLVLGGGGARGLSHLGVIRALTEAGIPIDMVGGTSIGSFVGALWAEETQRLDRFQDRARKFSREMSSLWSKLADLTYPQTAMFTGRAFNRGIEAVFRDRNIEDLWLPYFCITTDITKSQMRVHTSGSLWRYVRASMSLSGYLPPLCDPENGNLLLDGGYVNNLPADVMRSKYGPSTVFAVDVGSQDETNLTNYGDELSGWWLLYKKLNPFSVRVNVPNLTEIQSRLAYVSCVRQLESVKSDGICEYMRPPIEAYGTLQFGSFDEINNVGYRYCLDQIERWARAKKLPVLKRQVAQEVADVLMAGGREDASLRFTDLAEMVCRIDRPAGAAAAAAGAADDSPAGRRFANFVDFNDDDDCDSYWCGENFDDDDDDDYEEEDSDDDDGVHGKAACWSDDDFLLEEDSDTEADAAAAAASSDCGVRGGGAKRSQGGGPAADGSGAEAGGGLSRRTKRHHSDPELFGADVVAAAAAAAAAAVAAEGYAGENRLLSSEAPPAGQGVRRRRRLPRHRREQQQQQEKRVKFAEQQQ